MDLALFDFDGTISDRDSFLLFVRRVAGPARFTAGMAMLSPRIIAFLLGRHSNQALKEEVLTRFFRHWPVQRFQEQAEEFCREHIPAILRPGAVERIRWHRGRGDRIAVVSATPELILAPWCRGNGLELLATRLEVADGRLTGRIEGRNCRDREKVTRIRARYHLEEFDQVHAYGDTEGDRPMLALAHRPSFRPFR
ncbi:MAG TPA: HAD family hydrolase [Desulfobulbus sp.]|nr:HAD family hydrolase [Desulfobulbus sp.]